MAGVVPVVPPRTGSMQGKLDIETERFVTFDELCAHLPQLKAFFDELEKKGRRFLLVDCHCKIVLELELDSAPYTWQTYEAPRGGFAYTLTFDFGRCLPKLNLKKIKSLENCVVNICSRNYARGVTVDLKNNQVTYVHDSLWGLKGKGLTEDAKDILAILRWLIEQKKFKFGISGGESHYRKLAALPGGK